jgi:hypothetical protein
MFASVADNITAYGRKKQKVGMLIIGLIKRHESFYFHQLIMYHQIRLMETMQVSISLLKLCCIIAKGKFR